MSARVRLGCKIRYKKAAGWLQLGMICLGVIGQVLPYKPKSRIILTEGLHLVRRVAVEWHLPSDFSPCMNEEALPEHSDGMFSHILCYL